MQDIFARWISFFVQRLMELALASRTGASRLQEAPEPMVILSSQVRNAFDKGSAHRAAHTHTQSSPCGAGDEHDPHGVLLRLPENVPDNADDEVHGSSRDGPNGSARSAA